MAEENKKVIGWFTANGNHVPIFEKSVATLSESKKEHDIAQAKEQADKLNDKKKSDIDTLILAKFPKKIQSSITFLERDAWKKYHAVVNSDKYGEASFHDTSFSNMKYEITEFLKDGSRF